MGVVWVLWYFSFSQMYGCCMGVSIDATYFNY